MADIITDKAVDIGNVVHSKGKLSKAMQVTKTTINRWIKNGMPVREDGAYDIDEITVWRDARIVQAVDKKYPLEKAITARDFGARRAEFYLEDQAKNIRIQRIIREEALTRAKIKDMADQHLIAWFDKLGMDSGRKFEQERLELDKSTENVAVINKYAKEIRQRRGNVND